MPVSAVRLHLATYTAVVRVADTMPTQRYYRKDRALSAPISICRETIRAGTKLTAQRVTLAGRNDEATGIIFIAEISGAEPASTAGRPSAPEYRPPAPEL